jgi:hypothetical protein
LIRKKIILTSKKEKAMKKLQFTLFSLALLLLPLLLPAEVTREQADAAALEYIRAEVRGDYVLLRSDKPPGEAGSASVAWSNRSLHAESLSAGYPCWVYCIDNPSAGFPRAVLFLLIGKEDGSLLEVRNRQAYGASLEGWTEVAKASVAEAEENTIVRAGSSWSVLYYRMGLTPSASTQYIYPDGDSIVADKAYKKIFSCDDELHENIAYVGLIREQGKKTYFIPKNYEAEHLLYDFSLEEGTNFEYQESQLQIPGYENPPVILYVKKVDSVEINGVQKNGFSLRPLRLLTMMYALHGLKA